MPGTSGGADLRVARSLGMLLQDGRADVRRSEHAWTECLLSGPAMTCYNCSSEANRYYAEENGYTLVKCVRCNLIYLETPPGQDEITGAHIQGLHRGERTVQTTGCYNPSVKRRYRSVLKDLFRNGINTNAHWLDIGCGYGEFIETLYEFWPESIRVVGSEPNIHKQASARSRNLDVSFIDIDRHEEKYDYISLLNVLSHLPDPPSFLNKVKTLLKPSGELIIQTGDTANFSAKDHYKPFYLPDHISFISEDIANSILQRCGFTIVKIVKYPHPDYALSMHNILRETAKIFLPHYKSRLPEFFSGAYRYSKTDMYIRSRKT